MSIGTSPIGTVPVGAEESSATEILMTTITLTLVDVENDPIAGVSASCTIYTPHHWEGTGDAVVSSTTKTKVTDAAGVVVFEVETGQSVVFQCDHLKLTSPIPTRLAGTLPVAMSDAEIEQRAGRRTYDTTGLSTITVV